MSEEPVTKPVVATDAQLTTEERALLDAYEHVVKTPALMRGAALAAIRDRRLYRETHETFEEYCHEKWHWSKTHVNRLIQGAQVFQNLAPIGVTALRESQARELMGLAPEDQRLVVRFVRATAPAGGVTAHHLKSVVTVVRDTMAVGAIDDGTGMMVAWDELPEERKMALIRVNVDEDTFERHQRHRAHINQILRTSASNEWFTPQYVIDAAHLVLGAIDVDPASCEQANRTVQAATYYTTTTDGLKQDWPGRVWLNPPYGGLAGPFIERLIDQFRRDVTTEAIALVNAASTDTNWFQPLFDYPLCFGRRIHFDSPDGPTTSATHGSVLVYLGDKVDLFVDSFRAIGRVVRCIDR
jgi:hypothetical protein